MTRLKPDERVDVGVPTNDRWKHLYGEPRPSPTDEDQFADLAHRRRRNTIRDALLLELDTINQSLANVERQLGQVAPGDHRGYIRQIRNGVKALNKITQQ